MRLDLIYMPILRLRQEEEKVLLTFDFGTRIFPYVEIIKEVDRLQTVTRKGKPVDPRPSKSFEEIHMPKLKAIKAEKVFVDLPVHMKESSKIKPEVLKFLRKVVAVRKTRTEYILKLKLLCDKVIPVISTYSQRTGEINSIITQEQDLRIEFKTIAFRTSPATFNSDLLQIQNVALPNDYLIVDLDTFPADPENEEVMLLTDKLKVFKRCKIIIVRSAISDSITNVRLDHGKKIEAADNGLLISFPALLGDCFGDYAGIKKDGVFKGGGRSPGFIYFDAIGNDYHGFRGTTNSLGKSNQNLSEFETIIIPAVIACAITTKMKASPKQYLSPLNKGWQIIENIRDKKEPGRSAAKFKRISMEHYLHCIKTKIDAGDFE